VIRFGTAANIQRTASRIRSCGADKRKATTAVEQEGQNRLLDKARWRNGPREGFRIVEWREKDEEDAFRSREILTQE
jgi:hypothetical protein